MCSVPHCTTGHEQIQSTNLNILFPRCFNPLYTGGLFHSDMLDESICHFWGIGSMLSLLFCFRWNILLAKTVDPYQTPHNIRRHIMWQLIWVCTVCLWPFYGLPDEIWLTTDLSDKILVLYMALWSVVPNRATFSTALPLALFIGNLRIELTNRAIMLKSIVFGA